MFIHDLQRELDLAGIKVLPSYEGDALQHLLNCVQLYCGADVPALKLVELLKTRIKNSQVQFRPLVLPKNVVLAQLHRLDEIYVRYIEAYPPMSDKLECRYDILIRI